MYGDHSFTKSGRQRQASYATVCGWIVDAWTNVSAGTVVQAFAKAGIIFEVPARKVTLTAKKGKLACLI